MRKNRIIKNNKTPTTNRQWFNIAPPKQGKKHWVPYHSASELADYFLAYSGEVPPEIDGVLNELKIPAEAAFESEPECETPLIPEKTFGINGPRNHDLLMVMENEVVIGIEAKATEDLDKYVTAYKTDDHESNAFLRYEGLCKQILNREKKKCEGIRYQLLSAAAGTLIEAEQHHADKAILLVILFNSKIVPPSHVVTTNKNIEDFKHALKENGYSNPNSRAFRTPFKKDIDLYVEFLIVDVCSYKDKGKNK